ncbi:hypothetical protein WJX81_007626 [Elliptochloris bilobata]|uniref:Peroxisomal ATPase PEX1 n=1 Tax=Elliptochloris bilobata TaxID=381761 RepID=A0AAW1RSQ7_9CHLO
MEFLEAIMSCGEADRLSQLAVSHIAEKSCWVALPSALIARLLQAQAPLPLVLELCPAAMPGSLAKRRDDTAVWHVAWAGAAAVGQALEVPAALARRQSLTEGMLVSVRALPDTPAAQSVCVEPDSTDDWEQLELNAGYVEEQLLNQVGVVRAGQAFPVWVRGAQLFLRVTSTAPAPVVRLVPGAELAVAPRPRLRAGIGGGQQGGQDADSRALKAGGAAVAPPVWLRALDWEAVEASKPLRLGGSGLGVLADAAVAPACWVGIGAGTASAHGLAAGDFVHLVRDCDGRDLMLRVRLQAPPPGGLLICGAAGSGKSGLAALVADMLAKDPHCHAHVVWVACGSIQAEPLSQAQRKMEPLLREAVDCMPSLLVLDDLHLLCPGDAEGPEAAAAPRSPALAEWLADALDELRFLQHGAHLPLPVAVCATASAPADIAPVLRAAERLDCCLELAAPGAPERAALLTARLRERGASCANEDILILATDAEGYDAGDLSLLVDRALHAALRRQLAATPDRTWLSKGGLEVSADDLAEGRRGFAPAASWGVAGPAASAGAGPRGWEDVGGMPGVIDALREALALPTRFARLCARAPLRLRTGVLLYGPPGCGKTHAVAAALAATGMRYVSVKGPELLNKYIGASEAAVRDVFRRAAAAAPCVLFFDEFDAIAPQRGHDSTGVTDRVVNQLLTELDGVEGLKGVVVLAATSRPDLLDAALLRPGRLDRLLYCGMPSARERIQIVRALAARQPLAPGASAALDTAAREADGFSGADLGALLADAQLAAVHAALERSPQEEAAPQISTRQVAAAVAAARPSITPSERQRLEAVQCPSTACETPKTLTPGLDELIASIEQVSEEEWDACATQGGHGETNPFVLHSFLHALEASRSAVKEEGWLPQHVLLQDDLGRLLACCPLYLKSHSQGEYVFDHSWAQSAYHMGIRYYPKLQSCSPFSPVTGARLLVRDPSNAPALTVALARTLQQVADEYKVSSLHITFNTEEEWRALEGEGFLSRIGLQYHWVNRDYASFEDFLAALKQSKRKSIRQERKSVSASGLVLRRLSGCEITPKIWEAFYRFYRNTTDAKWGQAYLTRDFFHRLGETMGDRVVLATAAEADGTPVAGALNLRGSHALFGRNWGCTREVKHLHFELCYYQALDAAIQLKLPRVEAGAQGEHKIQRGYLPSKTYSSHYIRDPMLRGAVANFLRRERAQLSGAQHGGDDLHARSVVGRNKYFVRNADSDSLIAACTAKLSQEPHNTFALLIRASELLKTGQYAAACSDYDLVVDREPAHVDAHFQRGVALANLEQLDVAIAAYSRAIELDPGHVRALYARASCRNRKADFALANEDYVEALKLDDAKRSMRLRRSGHVANDDAAHARGFALRKRGDFLGAVAQYSAALEAQPSHFKALFNRAFSYDKLGQWAKAEADYTKVLQVAPRSSFALYNRGITRDRLGNYSGAVQDFSAAIMLDNKNADFYHNRGFSQRKQGRFEAAVSDYSAAIRCNPRHCRAYYNRAFANDRLGQFDLAVGDYSKALQLDDRNATAYHNRGALLERLGRAEEALSDYTRAIQNDGGAALSLNARGLLLERLGKLAEAATDFDAAVSLEPTSAAFVRNRGLCHRACGEMEAAIACFTRALQLAPNDSATLASRGYAYRKLREFGRAAADYERALATGNPRAPQLHINRAYCLAKVGRYSEALQSYNVVLQADPTNTNALHNRGISYDKLGRFGEAVEDFTAVLRLSTDPKQRANAYFNRGSAWDHLGEFERALVDFQDALELDPQCLTAG